MFMIIASFDGLVRICCLRQSQKMKGQIKNDRLEVSHGDEIIDNEGVGVERVTEEKLLSEEKQKKHDRNRKEGSKV